MNRFHAQRRPPDWSAAWVPDGKLEYYIGRLGHPKSADRALVFVAMLGFSEPGALRHALLAHARTQPVTIHRVTGHGVTYNAIGPLRGPSGVQVDRMISGWIVNPGSDAPRNVSAFPDRKRTR